MPTIEHATSYYAHSANEKTPRDALHSHIQADVCVIGAGYTGLSSALHLAECGFKVVVLEAARVGFGASGRNGGQIVHSYSRDMDFIEKRYGKKSANMLGSMAFEGGEIIRGIVDKYAVACDLKRGGVFAACNKRQMQELQDKAALWQRYGHTELELVDAAGIKNYVGSDRYVGGLVDHSGGHFHPLNLAQGEAAAIESLGGSIYEDSAALAIAPGEKVRVSTAGGSVTANYLVVAGNAYLGDLVPQLAQKSMPCGTQVITTEVLPESVRQELLPRDYCVEDCNYLLDYYRLTGDGRLLYGGGVTYGGREPDRVMDMIRPNMLTTFPQLDKVKLEFGWTGNFLLTLTRIPQFGRIGDNIYYAQGYSGHGITSTHLAGKLIAEVLQGQAERFDAFASLPHYPFPGGRALRIPFTAMGAWYYTLRDKLGI
jgi:gamma-glutamylputrescine oxidase